MQERCEKSAWKIFSSGFKQVKITILDLNICQCFKDEFVILHKNFKNKNYFWCFFLKY